ncbi:MAG: carboxypeptidase-like regulatory domain-containing protein [Candidatus Acidiferrum sp.]
MKRLRLLFLLALTPLSVHAAIFSGVVLDSQGASIHKAYVVIRWDSVGIDGVKENLGTNEIKTTTTDETGHFSLELPAGLYDIFVSAAGFSPHCEKIVVGATERHLYKAQLSVSRMLKISVD